MDQREWGSLFSDRFTVTLADGTEATKIRWEEGEHRSEGEYTFTQDDRVVARLTVQDRFVRRPNYVLELARSTDPILIVATCVVIDRSRRQRRFAVPA